MIRTALVAIVCVWPDLAAAQSATSTPGTSGTAGSSGVSGAPDSKAPADALFYDGKRLLEAGKLDEACPRFEASLRLLDQLGVRLNLADCYERQGRTASAWTAFREAAAQADKRSDARAAYARQRADALGAHLARLRISVPTASQLPGLAVHRDGIAVASDAFNSALPVDPGGYTIDASAPGLEPWSTHVDVRRPGDLVTVEVPRLVVAPLNTPRAEAPGPVARTPTTPTAPVAPAAPTAHDNPPSIEPAPDSSAAGAVDADGARHERHMLGIEIGAGGAIAASVGVVLGLDARSKWRSAAAHCDSANVCDAAGASINRSARQLGNAGTITGGVGLAALVTGAIIYMTAPAARSAVEHAQLGVDKDAGIRLSFTGRF